MADGDPDVVVLVARVVEVPRDGIEAELRADRVRCERLQRAGAVARVLEDEAADRIRRAGRTGRRVDERADERLVEREEDRVVDRRRRGAVVDREPLAVDDRLLHGCGVLRPVHPVVVGDGDADLVQRALEVGEVDVALVVVGDVGVAAARGRVGTRADRRDEVELLSVVRGAVDEGLVGRETPRARLPDRAVAVRRRGAARPRCAADRRPSRRRTSRSTSRSSGSASSVTGFVVEPGGATDSRRRVDVGEEAGVRVGPTRRHERRGRVAGLADLDGVRAAAESATE